MIRFLRSYLNRDWTILRGRPRTLIALTVFVAVVGFSTVGLAAWLSYEATAGLPNRDAINGLGDMAQSTTIFDADDKPVFTIFKEQRIEIPYDRISTNLVKAVISVEDQRFYDHSGVDAIRVAAAVLKNVEEGRRAEGGSTITQQLARMSFLSRDKTYRRKFKEIILAGYIESEYTKNQILEMYLNKVYLGDGLYGVEAAARGYLGKSASDLSVDEAALLAGLIQSPSSYAPTVNLERALARRSVVLQTMVNYGAIDAATAERARKSEVKLVERARRERELRPLLQGARAPRAGRAVRLAARLPGRAARVHDDADGRAEVGGVAGRAQPPGHREAQGLHRCAASIAGKAGRQGRPARSTCRGR